MPFVVDPVLGTSVPTARKEFGPRIWPVKGSIARRFAAAHGYV
jgi:hypothetical protein